MKEELSAKLNDKKELNINDMVNGIGRKATDEELIHYLSQNSGEPIDIEEAFLKYAGTANR